MACQGLAHRAKHGGEGGIRTPGTLRFSGFQDHRDRPLCHLSDGFHKTLRETPGLSSFLAQGRLTPWLLKNTSSSMARISSTHGPTCEPWLRATRTPPGHNFRKRCGRCMTPRAGASRSSSMDAAPNLWSSSPERTRRSRIFLRQEPSRPIASSSNWSAAQPIPPRAQWPRPTVPSNKPCRPSAQPGVRPMICVRGAIAQPGGKRGRFRKCAGPTTAPGTKNDKIRLSKWGSSCMFEP